MSQGSSSSIIRQEILQVAEIVAREKGIDREEILQAIETAIQKAGRAKYGFEHDIRATIDRKTGEIILLRYREVVADQTDDAAQLPLVQALAIDPTVEVGGFIIEPLPPIYFGRVAAQTAKQVIVQRVRDAERTRQFMEYQNRIGEVVHGIVKRAEFGNITVDLGKAEALIRRDEMIPRENLKMGDRVRAYIFDVRPEPRGPQVFLSRTHPQFMAKLFAQEVPEIYDGIIEIKNVARDPGSRAKIAVYSHDSSIDPVGSCVGVRGSRVQAVVGELQGEKVDIVPWSPNIPTFIVNALAPAEVTKVVMDEESNRVEVVVPDDQLSLAIGRRGQNVRLASHLTGWDIDVLTEAQESERRTQETKTRSKLFVAGLDVDDVLAHLLVAEGFTTLEEIAFVDAEELLTIEGLDESVAIELQERAKKYLSEQETRAFDTAKAAGLADELINLEGMTPALLVRLSEKGVKALDDFADLAGDELVDLASGLDIKLDKANQLIMAARAHWFDE